MSDILTFRKAFNFPRTTASVSDSVLVIVDVQKEYEEGAGPISVTNFSSTSTNIAKLLERYRAAGGDIIHVRHNGTPGAPVFSEGSEKLEVSDKVKPLEGETVVRKNYPSAFFGTNLEELIRATKKNKLVVVGYLITNCIVYTVGAAMERGFEVVVPRDCTSGRPLPGCEDVDTLMKAYLAGMEDFVCTVVESGEEIA